MLVLNGPPDRPNAVLAKYESSIDIQGTFDVMARDAYNNAVDYTGYNIGVWTVAVDVKLPAKVTQQYIKDNEDGTFAPRFRVDQVGLYGVMVGWSKRSIQFEWNHPHARYNASGTTQSLVTK